MVDVDTMLGPVSTQEPIIQVKEFQLYLYNTDPYIGNKASLYCQDP